MVNGKGVFFRRRSKERATMRRRACILRRDQLTHISTKRLEATLELGDCTNQFVVRSITRR